MYPETVSEILVFKTNLLKEGDIEKVAVLLNAHIGIRQWNIDQNDIDHVLRIEGDHVMPDEVINIVKGSGFTCEELPD
jgi:hypothetical protein